MTGPITYAVGDLVDVTIRGARVARAEDNKLIIEAHGAGSACFTVGAADARFTVGPAKPQHWPPLVGDLWQGRSRAFDSRHRLLAVDVMAEIGDPAETLVDDSGSFYSLEETLRTLDQLRLVWRRDGDAGPDGGEPS